MPEGDTIHKLAEYLGPRLTGRVLRGFRMRADPALDLTGREVESVSARGKHLFVRVGGALELRSHLGMHGSWHRYRPGEPWQRPERQAGLVLATDEDVFVCFHPREVECLRAGGLRARDTRRRLGPDLVADTLDPAELARRARALLGPDAPVIDLLLDQRVAAGIGNVYKNEVLFVERVDPFVKLGDLDDAVLERLYATARRLLTVNLRGGPRATRSGRDGRGALWVYRRSARPCHACGTPIRSMRAGRGRRSTYWCPRCQGPGPGS